MAKEEFGFKSIPRNYQTIKISLSDDGVLDLSFKKIKRKNPQEIKIKELLKIDD